MEILMQLFGSMIVFVYHCFDRIVINGYFSNLSRPELVVYFFKEILGHHCITKEVLSARTKDYNLWVESYTENHGIPLVWAQEGIRKEDYVRPYLKAMEHKNRFSSVAVSLVFLPCQQAGWRTCSAPNSPND